MPYYALCHTSNDCIGTLMHKLEISYIFVFYHSRKMLMQLSALEICVNCLCKTS